MCQPVMREPRAARHNLKTLVDQALVDKVAEQKKNMSIREICIANNMRQGDVAWLLYVAPKHFAEQRGGQDQENHAQNTESSDKDRNTEKSSKVVFRRFKRLFSTSSP